MMGQNTIILCPADMQFAVQYYLNSMVFRDREAVEVRSVKMNSGSYETFEISIAPLATVKEN